MVASLRGCQDGGCIWGLYRGGGGNIALFLSLGMQFNIILCDDYDDETELLSSDDNRGICLRVNILMNQTAMHPNFLFYLMIFTCQ